MKIQVNRKINAPAATIWAYLADFGNIQRFHPLLDNSHYVEGAASGELGATRQCNFNDGNFVKERVIDWQADSHYTVDIYESSMPFKSAQATLGVRRIAANETEAYMEVELTPKYSILAPMLYLSFRFVAMPKILKGLDELAQREASVALA
ncbi:MAG: SRPBCC family protein [Bacteroidota bacterium]